MKHATFRSLEVGIAVALVAGCATPLPDGSRIQRLPDAAAAPAPLSADEARALTELNARILAQQDEARRRDAELAALRQREPEVYWGLDFGYGWPYRRHHGWFWTGARWIWRPF